MNKTECIRFEFINLKDALICPGYEDKLEIFPRECSNIKISLITKLDPATNEAVILVVEEVINRE